MLTKTQFQLPKELFDEAFAQIMNLSQFPGGERRIILNQPTGNFFYDAWQIKDEYKNTVWQRVLDTLPFEKGEARLMKLDQETCYTLHADIDDRWHLNLSGNNCFLVDLDTHKLHPTEKDYTWWNMDAGRVHSAINFGSHVRYQLVIRQLLLHGDIDNPVNVKITPNNIPADIFRYNFDQIYSPWLNYKSKEGQIANFRFDDTGIYFTVDNQHVDHIKNLAGLFFKVNYE